jgi:hypothetical protein
VRDQPCLRAFGRCEEEQCEKMKSTGRFESVVEAVERKYFSFDFTETNALYRRPASERGASRSPRYARWDAMDAMMRRDEPCHADGEIVWS